MRKFFIASLLFLGCSISLTTHALYLTVTNELDRKVKVSMAGGAGQKDDINNSAILGTGEVKTIFSDKSNCVFISELFDRPEIIEQFNKQKSGIHVMISSKYVHGMICPQALSDHAVVHMTLKGTAPRIDIQVDPQGFFKLGGGPSNFNLQ